MRGGGAFGQRPKPQRAWRLFFAYSGLPYRDACLVADVGSVEQGRLRGVFVRRAVAPVGTGKCVGAG